MIFGQTEEEQKLLHTQSTQHKVLMDEQVSIRDKRINESMPGISNDGLNNKRMVEAGQEATDGSLEHIDDMNQFRDNTSPEELIRATANETVFGLRSIAHDVDFFRNYEVEEGFRQTHFKAVNDIYAEMGEEDIDALNEAVSMYDLVAIRDQIKASKHDQKIIDENTNVAGAFGLMALTSIIDPTSLAGGTLIYKGFKTAKIAGAMATANRTKRSAAIGASASAVEMSAEYAVQATGARQYESVGYTGMFAFVLAGGGAYASKMLKDTHTTKTDNAMVKLEQEGFKLKVEKPDEYRSLVEQVTAEDALSPYRSKIAKGLGKLLPESWVHSPSYMAWQRGGSIASLGALFDTAPGLLTKTSSEAKLGTADELIHNPSLRDGKTAMDVKYELAELQVELAIERMKAFRDYNKALNAEGKDPVTKEQFSDMSWRTMNDNYNRYITKKLEVLNEIETDKAFIQEVKERLETTLLDDKYYMKLDIEKKVDYAEAKLDGEMNKLARERMKDMPEFFQPQSDPVFGKFVEATNTYYKGMQEAMVKAKLPWADSFDPRFYMPRIYNKEAIRMDVKGAEKTFENAIKQSAEYKNKLAKAMERVQKASSKHNNTKADVEKMITLQQLEGTLSAINKLDDRLQSIMNDSTLSPVSKGVVLNQTNQAMASVINESIPRQFAVVIDGELRIVSSYNDQFWMKKHGDHNKKNYIRLDENSFNDLKKNNTAREMSPDEVIVEATRLDDAFVDMNSPEAARMVIANMMQEHKSVAELMKSTNTDITDFLGYSPEAEKAYSSTRFNIGGSAANLSRPETVIHELLHNLTKEMKVKNHKLSDDLKMELNFRHEEILDRLKDNGVDVDTLPPQFEKGSTQTYRERVKYMLNPEYDELFSVGLSNVEIAKVLNEMTTDIKVGGKIEKVSFLDKMFQTLADFLGVKVNDGSVLDQMIKTVKENAKETKTTVAEKKHSLNYKRANNEIQDITLKLEKYEKSIHESNSFIESLEESGAMAKTIDRAKRRGIELQKQKEMFEERYAVLAKEAKDSIASISKMHKSRRNKINKKIEQAKADIEVKIKAEKATLAKEVASSKSALSSVKDYPRQSSREAVKTLSEEKTLDGLVTESAGPPRLKSRKLLIDPASKDMNRYMHTNESDISHMYHYSTTGHIAVQHATGHTQVRDYMRELEDANIFDEKELKIAKDLFEVTKGTRQIANDPDAAWNKGVRMIKSFNYLTMGGQFAKYGVSEIGAGVYATGLGYLKEFVPALKTTYKMYTGKQLSRLEDDLVSLVEAGEIYLNTGVNKYSDDWSLESTFKKNGVEKTLQTMSGKMFRYSGLEGVTAATKIALSRSFMKRLIKASKDGRVEYDIQRWGLSLEDVHDISKQPVVYGKNGEITDFNFSNWDKTLADKTKLVISRMSRDAIMRPDATRIPAHMSDGNNPALRLMNQFMSFAAMANERLFLRGFSENRRGAIVGASISMALLATVEKSFEEIAVLTGLVDPENRKYTNDEEGMLKLAKQISLRNSFVGVPHLLAENVINYNSYNGGERVLGQLGGPTAGRVMNTGKAIGEYMNDGKIGSAAQANAVNSMIPFKVPVLAHYINSELKDMRAEAKENDYYRED